MSTRTIASDSSNPTVARGSLRRLGVVVIIGLIATVLAGIDGLTPTAGAQGGPAVTINEFLAANISNLADNTGEFEDWIELHNTSAAAVDLAGWTIEDSSTRHTFAALTIPAGSHLVVFASGDETRSVAGELHLPFRLDADGERLVLADPNGQVSTPSWGVAFPAQIADVSYGVDGGAIEGFFATPTPGDANSAQSAGIVEEVTFSVPHGFYDVTQTVVLNTTTPGSTIRYTTDGSPPSNVAGTVVAPGASVSMSQTTTLRAVAYRSGWITSEPATASYLFTADIIQQSEAPPPGWPADDPSRRMDYGMDQNDVAGNEALMRSSLTSIPTVSIVGETADIVDLYQNSYGRGMAWERPISIEYIDPSGAEPGFTIDGGLRIRGGASRNPRNPKHSLRLHFRDEYDGDLEYQFFDDGASRYEAISLGTGQHGSFHYSGPSHATWVREMWSRDAQGAMGQPYSRSDFVHVYLNGQYWGLFFTQERFSNGWGEEYFGGSESDYDVIGNATSWLDGAAATDGNLDAWHSLWPLVSDLQVDDAEYAILADQVDLDNLADHYLVFHLSGDGDSTPAQHTRNGAQWVGSNNWRVMRNRTGEGPGGGWMFFDHDSEGTFCWPYSARYTMNNTTPWNLQLSPPISSGSELKPAWLHEALLTHPAYRQLFLDRIAKHVLDPNGALTLTNALAMWDARVAQVSPAIEAESARWGDFLTEPGYDRATWTAAIDEARSCLEGRWPLVQSQLEADGLWPTVAAPTVSPASGAHPWQTAITAVPAGAGTLYVTLDGSDPRALDGSVAPGAIAYAGPLQLEGDTVVRARVLDGGSWSPLAEQTYQLSTPDGPPRLVLNEYNAVSGSRYLGDGAAGELARGSDATFGRVAGNGGDWFELVVVEDHLDVRGWTFEIWGDDGAGLVRDAEIVLGTAAVLSDLRAGTILTISEDQPDDVSYNPPAGDWHINLQSNAAGDGALVTVQSDFAINNDDTRIAVFDAAGHPEALRTGEGTAPNASVSSTEVFKLEAAPSSAVHPAHDDYNDGTSSTWGLPNVFDDGAQVQDLSGVRLDFGNPNCDASVTIVDALFIAQYVVGNRFDATCPLPDAARDIHVAAGDVNNNGVTDIIDALLISQCEVGIPNGFCP